MISPIVPMPWMLTPAAGAVSARAHSSGFVARMTGSE